MPKAKKKSAKKKAVRPEKTMTKRVAKVKRTIAKARKTVAKTKKAIASKNYDKKIKQELAKAEKRLMDNYQVFVKAHGKDWKKESAKYKKKVKKDLALAEKKIRAEINKKPEQSVIVAAAVGAAVAATVTAVSAGLLYSVKKKR